MNITLSFGQIMAIVGAIATPLGIIIWRLVQIDHKINMWLVEHETLVSFYCEQKGIRPEDLPTRKRMPW